MASRSRSTPPATCWARRRSGSSTAGRVWVVSGDYKTGPDATCAPFEPVRCDVFVTESTFGLPVFRWAPQQSVFEEIDAWWRANADAGRASVVHAYSFGKAQRVLAGIDAGIGPLIVHGAVATLNEAYRASGVAFAANQTRGRRNAAGAAPLPGRRAAGYARQRLAQALRRLQRCVRVRLDAVARRTPAGATSTVASCCRTTPTGPACSKRSAPARRPRIVVTHGYVEPLVRWLGENGWESGAFRTEYGDDEEPAVVATDEAAAPSNAA